MNNTPNGGSKVGPQSQRNGQDMFMSEQQSSGAEWSRTPPQQGGNNNQTRTRGVGGPSDQQEWPSRPQNQQQNDGKGSRPQQQQQNGGK